MAPAVVEARLTISAPPCTPVCALVVVVIVGAAVWFPPPPPPPLFPLPPPHPDIKTPVRRTAANIPVSVRIAPPWRKSQRTCPTAPIKPPAKLRSQTSTGAISLACYPNYRRP